MVMPARCAASTFSLSPPMGNTLPRRLISPVIATSERTLRPSHERDDRRDHRDARRGTVFRNRARWHVDVKAVVLEDARIDAERARRSSGRR